MTCFENNRGSASSSARFLLSTISVAVWRLWLKRPTRGFQIAILDVIGHLPRGFPTESVEIKVGTIKIPFFYNAENIHSAAPLFAKPKRAI
jgi:hypothetical protein